MALKDLYVWRERPRDPVNRAPTIDDPTSGAFPLFARDGAGLLSLDDKMYILGGWNTRGDFQVPPWGGDPTTNEVWSSPDGVTWTQLHAHDSDPPATGPDARWRRRHTAGWVAHNGRLFTIGSDDLALRRPDRYEGDIWSSADGLSWTRVQARARPFRIPDVKGRMLHAVGTHNGKLWLFGGHAGSLDPASALNDLWSSSNDGVTWHRRAVASAERPAPRAMIYDLVSWKGDVWLCGGGVYDGTDHRTSYNDVWRFDDATDQWTEVLPSDAATHERWLPRHYHNVVAFDGRLWVMGGNGPTHLEPRDRNLNDVWATEDGMTWEPLDIEPMWGPTHAAGACVTADGVWHATGHGTFDTGIVDTWVLTRR